MKERRNLVLRKRHHVYPGSIRKQAPEPYDFDWTMLNVNCARDQGDAHVIRIGGTYTILVDAGQRKAAYRSLLPFIEQNRIEKFDAVFISHAHKDHYGGLDILLDNAIPMREVYFNLPSKFICDLEKPWGCDYEDVMRIRRRLKIHGVPVKSATAGQQFSFDDRTSMEILYAFDGVTTPVGMTDINDTSLIMKFYSGPFGFLFTGDLNNKIGDYLATSSDSLKADVLKIPHHAIDKFSPSNTFLDRVSFSYGMVSTPKSLWLSSQSARNRSWFRKNGIPAFVNGIMGDVRLTVCGDRLDIHTSNTGRTALTSYRQEVMKCGM